MESRLSKQDGAHWKFPLNKWPWNLNISIGIPNVLGNMVSKKLKNPNMWYTIGLSIVWNNKKNLSLVKIISF